MLWAADAVSQVLCIFRLSRVSNAPENRTNVTKTANGYEMMEEEAVSLDKFDDLGAIVYTKGSW